MKFKNYRLPQLSGLMISCMIAACSSPSQRTSKYLEKPKEPEVYIQEAEEAKNVEKKPAITKPTGDKNYWIPAGEILAFELLLNQFDRHFNDEEVFGSNFSSIEKNLHGGWTIDDDSFIENQFGHPYQGSIYHGFARSCGLNYWESAGYTFAGSFIWEIAGETTRPSINDQITTGIGGSFLGESLYRMANLVLDQGGKDPSLWRTIGAAVISPTNGVNHYFFEDRFSFDSHDPYVFNRFRVGANVTSRIVDQGVSSETKRERVAIDFAMSYGLPGKPGYTYDRPFDYFQFEIGATSNSGSSLENVTSNGFLYGEAYESGNDYRGIWGLYGSYNYLAPELFRVSTTALSLGTTSQWWISDGIALQSNGLGGIGFGAAGPIDPVNDEPDHHYGVTPQLLLSFRLIFGDIAALDLSARGYYVSSLGSNQHGDSQTVSQEQIGLTVRIYERHAIQFQFLGAHRDGHYQDLPDREQSVGSFSIYYNLLSDIHFGAVEWRDGKRRQ